jgi:AcrR family transcriptional regulator
VHRLVDEAAVTRVTLYRHFPSKDDLVTTYLQDRAAANEAAIGALLTAHADDPRSALRAIAELVSADGFGGERRGCAFINAAAEEFELDHPVRAIARAHRAWIIGVTAELLRQMGHPTPEATAQVLMMLRTGAVVGASLDEPTHMVENFLCAWDALVGDAHR